MMGTGIWTSGLPKWRKYTVNYSDLSVANATKTLTLFALGAKEIIHASIIKSNTVVAGGTIAAATAVVGITGTTNKYVTSFNLMTAVSDTVAVAVGQANPAQESFANPTNILVTAVAVGDTWDNATAGQFDIWFLISKLP